MSDKLIMISSAGRFSEEEGDARTTCATSLIDNWAWDL